MKRSTGVEVRDVVDSFVDYLGDLDDDTIIHLLHVVDEYDTQFPIMNNSRLYPVIEQVRRYLGDIAEIEQWGLRDEEQEERAES